MAPVVGGALVDRLPAAVAEGALHKSGWLPPGCCGIDESVMIGAGLVTLADGGWFAIAAAASSTDEDFSVSVRWVGLAACRVHAVLSGTAKPDCNRPGDPPWEN